MKSNLRLGFAILNLCLLPALSVLAQLPHEVVLLVNSRSQASMKVANVYAAARGVPDRHIVHLDLPDHVEGLKVDISPEEFTATIWEPAWKQIRERGLEEERILAWIYSVDFPTRVNTVPHTSLTGLTLVRNQLPDAEMVASARAISLLFSGPFNPTADPPPRSPCSLDVLIGSLSTNRPLPAMMLGFLGKGGNSVEEVLACLERGVQSDATRPKAGIYFSVTRDKARSQPREWQYPGVVEELAQRGVTAQIITNMPAGVEQVMGLLTGAPTVRPEHMPAFAPGAMAEHLTSHAGNFGAGQTKLTAWIRAGATASCGTVTEPRNYWTKFPHARFYVYYASGCTMLESFYQSIASPLQQLIIGEPLARPWRLPLQMGVAQHPPQPPSTNPRFEAVMQPRIDKVPFLYTFLLDGSPVGKGGGASVLELDTSALADGYHELTVVGRVGLPVGHALVWKKGFVASTLGRSVKLAALESLGEQNLALTAQFEGEKKPQTMRLMHQGRVLEKQSMRFKKEVRFVFNERTLGEGPHTLRVVATYKDGMQVSSQPSSFAIQYTEEEKLAPGDERPGG